MQRFGGGDPEPLALTNREMNDAAMLTKYPAALVDNVAGLGGLRPQTRDQISIRALW